jgi:hypothetical protein
MVRCSNCGEVGHNKSKCLLGLKIKVVKEPMWDPVRDEKLLFLFHRRDSWDSISGDLARTVHACKVRIDILLTPFDQMVSKIKSFNIDVHIDSLEHQCSRCQYTFYYTLKEWRDSSLCDECYDVFYHVRRNLWKQVPSGPCTFCSKHYSMMQLDHLNMFDKGDSICAMIARGDPIEDILVEASKCQILCKSCHAIVTSIEQKLSFTRMKTAITKNNTTDDGTLDVMYQSAMGPMYELIKQRVTGSRGAMADNGIQGAMTKSDGQNSRQTATEI